MAGPVVTAAEMQNAPVISNPEDGRKPAERSRLSLTVCIVLGINSFFQFIAIVTPGWTIVTSKSVSTYVSVFYRVVCVDFGKLLLGGNDSSTECSSKTFLAQFQDVYDTLSVTGKAQTVLAYNLQVRYQLNIMFTWFIVVGSTVFQIFRYCKVTEAWLKLTTINIMALMCACVAMYQTLYEVFTTIDYQRRVSSDIGTDVGFPYSLFFYALAFVQTCAVTVLIAKQLFDYMRYLQCSIAESQVKHDTLKKHFDAERDAFRRYRDLHPDNKHLRPRSRGSYADDRRSGNHSPRPSSYTDDRRGGNHSPRPSPRSNARYRELLERSRASHQDTDDEHSRRPHDHSPRPRDHSPRPRDRSPRPHDHSPRPHDRSPRPRDHSPRPYDRSPRPRDHSPGPHDRSPRPRDYSPRGQRQLEQHGYPTNSNRDSSPLPSDRLLHSHASSQEQNGPSQEKSETIPKRQEQNVVDPENIELRDKVAQSETLSVAEV